MSNEMFIKPLSVEDGIDVYMMLQRIGGNENEFKNTAYGLTETEFKDWLIEQNQWLWEIICLQDMFHRQSIGCIVGLFQLE